MQKFQEGKTYVTTDWFTGGIHYYKCISRAETKVIFLPIYYEMGVSHETDPETYDILSDNEKEYVLLYEYHGEEHRLYAE